MKKRKLGHTPNMLPMKIIDCQDYSIHIGDSRNSLADFLKGARYSKIGILVDENTRKYCLPILMEDIDISAWTIIEIEAGEEHKNLRSCEKIWKRMLMAGFDRHSLLINLGGGVIGDMGGFCASTYMRGIDFLQIPTTLLAQVDASVGGKLGIDLEFVKNIIGLFNNPQAVFVDKKYLNSLEISQIRSGFAEVVKHGLIAQPAIWNQCKEIAIAGIPTASFDDELLYHSIAVKKQVVEQDPREKGLRKILNFGHTIGHAVETHSWTTDKPLLHGEAVFIGMACENYLAYAKKLISKKELDDINSVLKKICFLPKACINGSDIWKIVLKDKKNKLDKAFTALIDQIGSAVYDIEITREEVMESLFYYQKM